MYSSDLKPYQPDQEISMLETWAELDFTRRNLFVVFQNLVVEIVQILLKLSH